MISNIQHQIMNKTVVNEILIRIRVLEDEIVILQDDYNENGHKNPTGHTRQTIRILQDRVEQLKDELFKLDMGDIL
jgi:hypothetical protein